MDGRTYYMILGVSPTASEARIRTAYHDLARRLHPDVAGQEATHAFQEISEAYDVLSDPRRRREYNEELRREQHGAAIAVHRTRAAPKARDPRPIPRVCPECGVAGAIFMPADPDDLMTGDSDGDGLRASWLRTGIEKPDLVGRA